MNTNSEPCKNLIPKAIVCCNKNYNSIISALLVFPIEIISINEDLGNMLDLTIKFKPDFFILCLRDKDCDLIEITKVLRTFSSVTHIIVVLSNERNFKISTENLNVSGIITENFETEELTTCLHAIRKGFRYVNKQFENKKITGTLPDNLTNQEKKVLELLGQGTTSNQCIAEKLFLSPHTIKNHKDNILKKFKLHKMLELYLIAIELNFRIKIKETA